MLADGRAAGAIVVEHRARHRVGVERRVAAMLGQLASIAALNLRNAVLLRHVQDLAERDSLTGAANRRMFQLALERVLQPDAPARPADRVTAVLFLDLDDFKVVNDTLGHATGDALLVAVDRANLGLVREGDLVARLGGDEFAVLADDDPRADPRARDGRRGSSTSSARRTSSATSTWWSPPSVGIASARDAISGAIDLVRNADVAMYMAKANGKAGFAIFDPGMHEAMRERHELASTSSGRSSATSSGCSTSQSSTSRPARWRASRRSSAGTHPTRGLIIARQVHRDRRGERRDPADRALGAPRSVPRRGPLAETGRVSAGTVPQRQRVGPRDPAAGFVDGVKATLAEPGLPPTRLSLEITETALLKATPATVATLDGAARGSASASSIDDFGTGYFSLSHLRQFPVDALKIASEFVQDADADSKSSALAGAIVAMGGSLGIRRSPRGSRRRPRPSGCARSAARSARATSSPGRSPRRTCSASSEPPTRRSHRRLRSPVRPVVEPQPRPAGVRLRSRRPIPRRGAGRRSGRPAARSPAAPQTGIATGASLIGSSISVR